ncbi:hypothetical protein MANES_07G075742v8 [Manihot esculenta]|uniref:Uncharacterized protein n=1 Tax=Manihot esculenta TaxID=3983 RepID=A0ACB7HFR0_MANES|nr:hypothetical protein MANES_07G075742v8 [Manihot esculenta]
MWEFIDKGYTLLEDEASVKSIVSQIKRYGKTLEDSHQALLLALKDVENNDARSWLLDNGASNHMYEDKEIFVLLDEEMYGKVSFTKSLTLQIYGKAIILISSEYGFHKLVTIIYYMPQLKSNCLSLGQILKRGCEIHMKYFCF